MTYEYIRVSTSQQTVENQRDEILRFCEKENITIDSFVVEVVSGTKDYQKRELGKLLKKLQEGDIIICTELSRIGRSLYMIMEILSYCMDKNCKVWTLKDNFRLGDDIQSKVLAFAFGLSAEIERQLISQRTKEALETKRAMGQVLGRPKGALSKHTKLSDKEDTIQTLLNLNNSYASIARMLQVDRSTLTRFCKSRGIKPSLSCNKF